MTLSGSSRYRTWAEVPPAAVEIFVNMRHARQDHMIRVQIRRRPEVGIAFRDDFLRDDRMKRPGQTPVGRRVNAWPAAGGGGIGKTAHAVDVAVNVESEQAQHAVEVVRDGNGQPVLPGFPFLERLERREPGRRIAVPVEVAKIRLGVERTRREDVVRRREPVVRIEAIPGRRIGVDHHRDLFRLAGTGEAIKCRTIIGRSAEAGVRQADDPVRRRRVLPDPAEPSELRPVIVGADLRPGRPAVDRPVDAVIRAVPAGQGVAFGVLNAEK